MYTRNMNKFTFFDYIVIGPSSTIHYRTFHNNYRANEQKIIHRSDIILIMNLLLDLSAPINQNEDDARPLNFQLFVFHMDLC